MVKNGRTYLYENRSYRDQGKVKQESRYLGIETEVDGRKTVRTPRNRASVRKILESSGYILYRVAEEYGFVDRYSLAINDLTRISNPAGKIVMLAAECITGPEHSIHLHTGIPELKEKEIRDLIDLVGSNDPDIIAILEKSMAKYIMDEFGSSGIVYDLSAIRYYGSSNDLARFGHYYHMNGENREINFVLAVTRKNGIPVHHRPMAGNIPSVSTISTFAKELKDYGILAILIVMDRGFYSDDNMKDLKDYSIIGALPSSLSIHDDLIHGSGDIENSRNYLQYGDETIFHREERISGTRYMVYFSPRLRSQRLESFYSQLSEREETLSDLKNRKFRSQRDRVATVESALKGFRNLMDIQYSDDGFTYELKHKAIQRRTNRFGYTILFTNTRFPPDFILRTYREKDVVEKAFSHVKPHLEPFFSRSERGTRARLFLTILGYTMAAIIAARCDIPYDRVMKTISGIREVVYSNGSHSHVEYTREQRELLEKLEIEL